MKSVAAIREMSRFGAIGVDSMMTLNVLTVENRAIALTENFAVCMISAVAICRVRNTDFRDVTISRQIIQPIRNLFRASGLETGSWHSKQAAHPIIVGLWRARLCVRDDRHE